MSKAEKNFPKVGSLYKLKCSQSFYGDKEGSLDNMAKKCIGEFLLCVDKQMQIKGGYGKEYDHYYFLDSKGKIVWNGYKGAFPFDTIFEEIECK